MLQLQIFKKQPKTFHTVKKNLKTLYLTVEIEDLDSCF
jgi:hypothetical protein